MNVAALRGHGAEPTLHPVQGAGCDNEAAGDVERGSVGHAYAALPADDCGSRAVTTGPSGR
jgi:hypothetical protein